MATTKQPHNGAVMATARALPVARWEHWLHNAVIVLGRLGLAVLFITQLGWKVPPTFGCDSNYTFTTADASGNLRRGDGLCDWIGVEAVYATRERAVLGLNIGPLARLNGAFVDGFVKPNIRWFGYVIFLSETFIAVSMLLGLLSRAGALVAIGMSMQLLIGLAGIQNPFEWEWSYILMVLLAVLMFGLAPGRLFGLDALLRPRLAEAAARGSQVARAALVLT